MSQNHRIGLPEGTGGVAVDPHDATFETKMDAIYEERADKIENQHGAKPVPADESDGTKSVELYQQTARRLGAPPPGGPSPMINGTSPGKPGW